MEDDDEILVWIDEMEDIGGEDSEADLYDYITESLRERGRFGDDE